MSRTKRSGVTILVLGVLCLLLLFWALRTFEGYADRVEQPPPAASGTSASDSAGGADADADADPDADGAVDDAATPEASEDGGPQVVFADGSAAAGAVIEADAAATGVGVVRLGPLRAYLPESATRIELPATFELSGSVISGEPRTAVAGATVSCAGVETVTNADGSFRLPNVPGIVFREAQVVVTVRSSGFAPLDFDLPKDQFLGYYGDLLLRVTPE